MKMIIFTGAPASGKSSLAETVGKIINTDVISKDEFKIELFEKYGFKNHDEKRKLSIKSEKMLYEYIKKYIFVNEDIIIDNNFNNFDEVRMILKNKNSDIFVDIYCVFCSADYATLAERYNKRILSGNRHQALYTLNQYPVIEGVSVFHPLITKEDVERMEQEIQEITFGEKVLIINTVQIETEFEYLCDKIIDFIRYERY